MITFEPGAWWIQSRSRSSFGFGGLGFDGFWKYIVDKYNYLRLLIWKISAAL
jgi:hypothetical protein